MIETVNVLEAGEDALAADIACALADIRRSFAQAKIEVQNWQPQPYPSNN